MQRCASHSRRRREGRNFVHVTFEALGHPCCLVTVVLGVPLPVPAVGRQRVNTASSMYLLASTSTTTSRLRTTDYVRDSTLTAVVAHMLRLSNLLFIIIFQPTTNNQQITESVIHSAISRRTRASCARSAASRTSNQKPHLGNDSAHARCKSEVSHSSMSPSQGSTARLNPSYCTRATGPPTSRR